MTRGTHAYGYPADPQDTSAYRFSNGINSSLNTASSSYSRYSGVSDPRYYSASSYPTASPCSSYYGGSFTADRGGQSRMGSTQSSRDLGGLGLGSYSDYAGYGQTRGSARRSSGYSRTGYSDRTTYRDSRSFGYVGRKHESCVTNSYSEPLEPRSSRSRSRELPKQTWYRSALTYVLVPFVAVKSLLTGGMRGFRKTKADREFSKTYAPSESQASKEGPRAAFYKTELGHSQKRAARMQLGRDDTKKSGFGFSILDYPKTMIAIVSLVIVVAMGAFIYPPAQQYYVSIREQARLEAEYAAITERNEKLQNTVDYLQSDAGIEQRARDEFGWVKAGEEAVKVTGVNIPEEESSVDHVPDVLSSDVEAPETWYSPFLDKLFGVS